MVGKVVGLAAFLSLIVLVWLLMWRAEWSMWAIGAGFVLFLLIGAFASIDTSEWRKKGKP